MTLTLPAAHTVDSTTATVVEIVHGLTRLLCTSGLANGTVVKVAGATVRVEQINSTQCIRISGNAALLTATAAGLAGYTDRLAALEVSPGKRSLRNAWRQPRPELILRRPSPTR